VLEVDLTDEDSIIKAAKQFGDENLDILINCAGDNSQTSPLIDVH
jgi:NAD(P)-dependent dehydrogenase (short-subunit alcohol dehydrogenase family)